MSLVEAGMRCRKFGKRFHKTILIPHAGYNQYKEDTGLGGTWLLRRPYMKRQ
jgi:hypothetical protein